MQQLYSCRNCIHNPGQSLSLGQGQGYCLKHESVLIDPVDTTCKYHHRKDLPNFVTDEGRREHAAEFAEFPALVSLRCEPRKKTAYSEKHYWQTRRFDPLNNALARYHKSGAHWIFIQTFAGNPDARHALVHGSMVRRYMDHCGTWTSSYRMVLALVQDLMRPIHIESGDLHGPDPTGDSARWDVFFTKLSGLQEYGFHAGVSELMWASDGLGEGLSGLNWGLLNEELQTAGPRWIDQIIAHAVENDGFFPPGAEEAAE